ncbi:MAG: InlB B-repeat-containing protein [Candidatus Dojkabacteria bacterium]|jgi:hypothetical protein
MSNMNVKVGSKGMVIVLIIGAILLGGGGGYLLWRVNQPKTVAPTDSDAYVPKMCRRCKAGANCYIPKDTNGQCNPMGDSEGRENVGCTDTTCCAWSDTETYPCGVSKYHITYNAGDGGTVTNAGQNEVNPGGSIGSEAKPNTGYIFKQWSDGKTTATRTDSNVQADATYTATFETAPVEKFTLKYTAGTGGSIVGSATQTVEKGKDGTSVEAKADTNYKFDKWSDNKVTTATRTDTNVQANITVKAEFKMSCGDNICDPWEDVNNCPTDCEGCGDGKCIPPENAITCPRDCPVTCGDGICSEGENKANCPVDCGGAATTVPDTGIFDNSKHTMIFGAVILVIGLAWTWISTLPKKAYVFVSNTSDNFKEKKEKNIRDNRRSRLERRIK